MIVRNNYNECLTNLACSIRKNFELEYQHNTIDYIDKILYRNPKNVVTILFDGMGSNILDRTLNKDDFLIRNRIKPITTVFPATTVAATTSITTGLNPVETGMLGWNMYFKDIDKTITTFMNSEKGDKTRTSLEEARNFKHKYMKTKTIVDDINEKGKYEGYNVSPIDNNKYSDMNEMLKNIKTICNNSNNRKYIYAYDDEPDHMMHKFGTECKEVRDIIRYKNIMVEQLSNELKDTVIFVIADHGHLAVENIFLEDYPDVIDCLERNTSIEPRAVNFFIKKDKKSKFEELFNKYFSKYFNLYKKEDVINSKLFGDGEENPIFRSALGDYLAIGIGNKTILYGGDDILKSQHSGYTDDEIFIPLIAIDNK